MIDYLWIKILCPIWSFIINILYWLFHLHLLKENLKLKKSLLSDIKTIDDVKTGIELFVYTSDKFKDWTPWVVTFFAREKHGDCDDAAVYGKFLFKCAGISSSLWSLRGKTGHMVCVSKDEKYMISNNQLIELDGVSPLKYFNGKYDRIIK